MDNIITARCVFLVFFVIATFHSADAQIAKENWMMGGDISFRYSKSSDKTFTDYSFDINPMMGYFFVQKLAGGIRLASSFSKTKWVDGHSTTSNYYQPGIFVRYYFLGKENCFNVFADGEYFINWYNSTGYGSDASDTDHGFNAKAGGAYFLSQHMALELSFNYNHAKSTSMQYYNPTEHYIYDQLKIMAGFQLFLQKKGK